MATRLADHAWALAAFVCVVLLGQSYFGIQAENLRQRDALALTKRVEQQTDSIKAALGRAEMPLSTLAEIVTVRRGEFPDFELYARHLLQRHPFVSGLFLVPGGVVAEACPLEGNEAAIGHDLLKDPERRTEVLEAITSSQAVLAGPVNMRQGGVGLFARKPVFWEEDGERRLWGLVVALIKWESVLGAFELDSLAEDGFAYVLNRKLRTDPVPVVMSRSVGEVRPDLAVTRAMPVPGGEWRLTVSPVSTGRVAILQSGEALTVPSGLVIAGLVFHLARNRRRILAQTGELERVNADLAEDIARREMAEAELLEAKNRAEAATRSQSEFLATMSHEIRTPMNGVHGMLQLLETTPLDGEQREFVDIGSSALRNLLNLVNDILDFSKIEAGRMTICETPFAVSELCRSIPDIFRGQIQAKDLRVEVHTDGGVPQRVLGDPSRIRQVLLNLVGNAVKFTEKGSVNVALSARRDGLPPGRVRLEFEVRDTGPGIAPERIPDLFEPFTQASGSLTRTYQGTGLGLSIVRRLVRLMGGDVSVDSAPGQGSTFRFSVLAGLPDDDAGTEPDRAAGRAGTPGKLGLRVLVAEDDLTSMTMMTRLLEKAGCSVIQAEDGGAAVRLAAEEDVDLVLMDIQMPVMDGVEAARRIRADSAMADRAGVPIIAVTAYAMSGDRERFLEAGMNEYLPKPVDMPSLVSAIGRVVETKGSPST